MIVLLPRFKGLKSTNSQVDPGMPPGITKILQRSRSGFRLQFHGIDHPGPGAAEHVVGLAGEDVDIAVLHRGDLSPHCIVFQLGDDLLPWSWQLHHRDQQVFRVLNEQ